VVAAVNLQRNRRLQVFLKAEKELKESNPDRKPIIFLTFLFLKEEVVAAEAAVVVNSSRGRNLRNNRKILSARWSRR
jgi:hypothetical protein